MAATRKAFDDHQRPTSAAPSIICSRKNTGGGVSLSALLTSTTPAQGRKLCRRSADRVAGRRQSPPPGATGVPGKAKACARSTSSNPSSRWRAILPMERPLVFISTTTAEYDWTGFVEDALKLTGLRIDFSGQIAGAGGLADDARSTVQRSGERCFGRSLRQPAEQRFPARWSSGWVGGDRMRKKTAHLEQAAGTVRRQPRGAGRDNP